MNANGPLRVFTLLHHARPVLLNLGEPGNRDVAPWADRVQLINAKYAGPWDLPAIGTVTALTAVLIRPDGYIAWTGNLNDERLANALTGWSGAPADAWRTDSCGSPGKRFESNSVQSGTTFVR